LLTPGEADKPSLWRYLTENALRKRPNKSSSSSLICQQKHNIVHKV